MWSTRVDNTQTGELVQQVEHDSISWGRGDQTTRTSSFILSTDSGRDRDYWRAIFAKGWDHKITHLWDDEPVYSGLIMGQPSYDRVTRTLGVSHVDPTVLTSRRWSHGVGTSNGEGGYQRDGYFEVVNKSLEGALTDVLRQAFTAPIVPAWPIAAIIGASEAGSFSKKWPHYEFENAADMALYLSERSNGPDFDMQPVMVGDECWWQLRVGTPLTGPLVELDLAAADSPVESWSRQSDDSETATGIHFPGKGSEKEMRVGAAFLSSAAGLARDSIFWNKNESNVSRLSTQAAGRLAGMTQPARQWSLEVRASKVNPASLRIGSTVRLHLWESDPWLPEQVDTRLVGFSGDDSDFYTIETVEL